MSLYLLNNKKQITDDDSNFTNDDYEYPGWNHNMSYNNRSLYMYTPLSPTKNIRANGWYYRPTWVKKLNEL